MITFHNLSPEAAILFVIAEPLRRMPDLTSETWLKRAFIEWCECTDLDFEAFQKAFGEVDDWLKSKGRK